MTLDFLALLVALVILLYALSLGVSWLFDRLWPPERGRS